VSFWGSNIAFGKLQEILPGRPIMLPGRLQTVLNAALLLIAVALALIIALGTHSEALFIGILVASAVLGNAVVLPIGGAARNAGRLKTKSAKAGHHGRGVEHGVDSVTRAYMPAYRRPLGLGTSTSNRIVLDA